MNTSGATAPNPRARVAIISPYYNRETAVEPTFKSIAAQTFQDFVALIWDDCSTDGTWEEMRRVSDELADARFTIYRHDRNLGFTEGLNRAIAAVDADYIAVVGSGDTCDPDRIRRQVEALDADSAATFCATATATSDPETGVIFFDETFSKSTIRFADIEHTCPFTHGSVMYRTSSLRDAGGYASAFTWCSDWDLFFRLLKHSHAIYLDDVLYQRVAQLDGASFNPEKAFIQIACKHLAIDLAHAAPDTRSSVLRLVEAEGVSRVITTSHSGYRRDLARRNVKLHLMGRRAAAAAMARLARSNGVVYPLRYRGFLQLARLMSYLPLRAGTTIRAARALPR